MALRAYIILYTLCLVEAGLVAFLLHGGLWRRLRALFAYAVCFLLLDGAGRSFILSRYGFASRQYSYFFWLGDIVLTLAAFLLICAFFRRACLQQEKLWDLLRVMLLFVFILVVGISLVSLSQNYSQLFSRFIIEFEQNLYFACLVLNTLLYILMQQLGSRDEELGLLVCGMGIQYAGQAAGWALVHLTPGAHYAQSLQNYIAPLCTLGMFLTWFYAVGRAPKAVADSAANLDTPALAQASVTEA